MDRNAVISAKRIVIKIGSSSLTGSAGSALDSASVEKIVSVIATLKSRGAEVALVSSGAIAAGLAPLKLTTRPKDLPTQQAAASVGQGLLIARYNEAFTAHSILSSQVLHGLQMRPSVLEVRHIKRQYLKQALVNQHQ